MQKLTKADSNTLTEPVLKLLHRNGISTVGDLLREEPDRVAAISKLALSEVLLLKSAILQKYSAPVRSGEELYKTFLRPHVVPTGISRLNEVLNGGLPIGYMTEICGLANTGKTQLCLQIAINCVSMSGQHVLYVDTKGDFSSIRVQKILELNGKNHKEMALIMSKIKICNVWRMEDLLNLLDTIIEHKLPNIEIYSLIIVDSLPALMFQYLGDQSKIGLTNLNNLANKFKLVSNKYGLSIIIINIQSRWIDADPDIDEDNETTESREQVAVERKYRCLGKYWQYIPAIVLQLEKCECRENLESDYILNAKVLKSSFGKANASCNLVLNNRGVA